MMLISRLTLVRYLDELLDTAHFADDVSNNGLQVEGDLMVEKIVFGVDGSLALFRLAAAHGANFIIVHHGISWGAEPRRFTGIHASRLQELFTHNVSLYAAHLPLDVHPELGNNARLCTMIGMKDLVPCHEYRSHAVGFCGKAVKAESPEKLASRLDGLLGGKSSLFRFSAAKTVKRAVVVSGGGADAVFTAAELGADTVITGEMPHQLYHSALELKVNVIALGHYASETIGVKALMSHLEKKFKIPCEFIDVPTGL